MCVCVCECVICVCVYVCVIYGVMLDDITCPRSLSTAAIYISIIASHDFFPYVNEYISVYTLLQLDSTQFQYCTAFIKFCKITQYL